METKSVFELLQAFVERAEKMGKYPPNSAGVLKSTIKTAASLITDEEPREIGYLRDHAAEIFARSTTHSSASMQSYIGRLKRLIEDFESYGSPPSAMLNWKTVPRVATRRPRRGGANQSSGEVVVGSADPVVANTNVLSLALREGVKVRLELPPDLSSEEAERICALVKSLASFAQK